MSIFFKGLNELRGLAALAVVFHHIELYKHREKIGSLFKNNVLMLLIGVIVVKFLLYYAAILGSRSVPQLKNVVSFLRSFNIELMAMGGIGAYLLIHGRLERVYARLPRFANVFFVLTSLLMLWFSLHYLLLSFFFLLLILLNINDKHTFFRGKFFTFVGDISYGVYMYHPLIMFFVFTGVQYVLGNENLILFNGLIYALIFGFTILISYLSFRYFESFFLRQKEKFIVVASGKKVTP